MALKLRPTAGTVVSLSASRPASATASEYASLSWTPMAGFDDIGAIGNEFEQQSFDAINGGRIKYRGIEDPGEIEGSPADLPEDPGQQIAKTAFDAPRGGDGEIISIKIEDESGIGTYGQMKVNRWRRQYGGAQAIQLRNVMMLLEPGSIVEY